MWNHSAKQSVLIWRRDSLHKKLLYLSLFCILICTVLIVGCGEDESVEIKSVNPPDGSSIPTDTKISVNFSSSPINLVVSRGEVNTTDNTLTISGPFELGTLEIEITWDGGNRTLTYTVESQVSEDVVPEGMVLIPEGEYQMGSLSREAGNVEEPGHTIYIDAFYIDVYEVTNAAYKRFIDANPEWQKDLIEDEFHDGNYLANWTGNSFPNSKADHPVVSISWYAAVAYAQWVGKRLPTEAEWEKAARGGVEGQRYPWGNSIDEDNANYTLNVGLIGNTTPVGDYPPNGYGLYDMIGNVLELCLDRYERNYYDDPSKNNPIGGTESIDEIIENYLKVDTSRSIRGGSWVESGQPRVWIIYRRGNETARTSHLIGFRCAKSQSQ